MTTLKRPHNHQPGAVDTPKPVAPAALPYPSLDAAVLNGDFATADAYFAHENRTDDWLRAHILGIEPVAGHFDPLKPADPWTNNAVTSSYASDLLVAYRAYVVHRG